MYISKLEKVGIIVLIVAVMVPFILFGTDSWQWFVDQYHSQYHRMEEWNALPLTNGSMILIMTFINIIFSSSRK